MSQQSSNHLLMVEPASFYANPETMETNVYQVQESEPREVVFAKALKEFREFRDVLVEAGVMVTTVRGFEDCPDMVFPNCLSTHRDDEGGKLFIYPMLNENRQAERDDELIEILQRSYDVTEDWTLYETEGRAIESTASIVMDRVNKVGYSGLSARSDRDLVQKWCDLQEYELVGFETQSHAGKPVYHTDCVMWIGTSLAGVCSQNIVEEDRGRVMSRIKKTHKVVEFDPEQLKAMCGNALEVIGESGLRYLAMSSAAYRALREDQEKKILQYFDRILHSPLDTLETYGGGSARCMLMELF
ncbi:MAG: arginine deiminase-related protein [Bdellovibrionales bacterium]